MEPLSLLPAAFGLVFSPLLLGVINRVKSVVAGRRGPPLLQVYFDLARLLRKGAVYSSSATWAVKMGPVAGLAAVVVALLLVPLGPIPAALAFPGDLLLLAGLLAFQRFSTMLASMDVGSSFEGMGASREAFFSTLAEPALIVGLLVTARGADALSLSQIAGTATASQLAAAATITPLVAVALFLVFLAENSRVPVDDPNTHLELTMIHEVMVLDHGGVDFAYISYAACLKLWVLGALLVAVLVPLGGQNAVVALAAFLASMVAVAAATGAVESFTARLRLDRVPRLLVGASGLCAVAFLLVLF